MQNIERVTGTTQSLLDNDMGELAQPVLSSNITGDSETIHAFTEELIPTAIGSIVLNEHAGTSTGDEARNRLETTDFIHFEQIQMSINASTSTEQEPQIN